MAELAKAYVQIVPTMSESGGGSLTKLFNGSGMTSQADSAGKGIGGALVKGILGVVSVAAIGKVIGDALSAGGDLQQSIGGVETLYGEAADSMKQYANEAYKYGLSANDYMEQSTSFAAALKQSLGGDVTQAAEAANMALEDMADNSAKLGTPIESLQTAYQGFAKQNYTMLDNLKLGYGGTKTEMERLLADATKMAHASGELAEGEEYHIENLADVYKAIHLVQDNLGLTGVAAAEASTTFTGSMGAMKAAATNALASLTLGQNVGPALTALAQTVSTFLFQNLLPMVGNFFVSLPSAIGAFIQTAIPLIQTNLTSMVGQITGSLPSLSLPSIMASLNALLSQALAFLTTNLPQWQAKGMEFLLGIFNGIMSSIPTVLVGLSSMLGQIFSALSASLPQFLQNGVDFLSKIFDGIIANIPAVITGIGTMLSQALAFLLQNLPLFLQKGVELLTHIAQGIIRNIPAIVTAIAQVIARLIQTLLQNMPQFLQKGIELIGKVASGIVQAIPNVISAMKSAAQGAFNAFKEINWLELGSNVISGIVSGITGAAGSLFGSLKDLASQALNAAKDALKVGSPSRLFRDEVGRWIPRGISVGIEDTVPEVEATLSGAARRLVDAANVSGFTPAAAPTQSNRLTRDDILLIAEAVRAGMEDITVNTTISEKSFKRGLTGMGVRFA